MQHLWPTNVMLVTSNTYKSPMSELCSFFQPDAAFVSRFEYSQYEFKEHCAQYMDVVLLYMSAYTISIRVLMSVSMPVILFVFVFGVCVCDSLFQCYDEQTAKICSS